MADHSKGKTIHLFHHAFRRGGGKERYAIALAAALKQLGHPVVVHTINADRSVADSLGIDLNILPISSFPRRLESFRFFRAVQRLAPTVSGYQITLSRAPVRDLLVSGGTHLGYLQHAKKWTGPFDLLATWMERQA